MIKCLIILMIIIIVAVASFDKNINVGTTLFSRTDLDKLDWSATEFGLLKARRYFQDLLPSGSFISTANDMYINNIFKYFKDTYSTIKRQTSNETTNQVMTIAFSDAVGGYLKFWALPVTKIGFYGGTVSQNNIVKLSLFYNELKKFLETDGDDWRSPNRNLLRDTTLNVAPSQHLRRSMRNPCEELVLEEGPFGLIIPVPNIHWEDRSSTMFIPVKKKSIIPLESPDYPNALLQYYDTAKNCIEENKPGAINEFEERFQSWLIKEVMPHLCDENIYLALGNVLSLVNKTQDLGRKCYHVMTRKVIAGFPLDLSSKKTLFIVLVLILEMVWCIPALIYLACSRKSKKYYCEVPDSLCSTDSSDDTHANNSTNKALHNFIKGIRKEKRCIKSTEDPKIFQRGLKLEQKPRADIINFESVSIPPEPKSSVTSKAAVSFKHKAMNVSLKASMKKIYSSHLSRSQFNISVTPKMSKSSLTNSKVCDCSKCTIYDYSSHSADNFIVANNPVESNDHPVEEALSNVTNVISKSDTYTVKLDKPNSSPNDLSIKNSLQDLEQAFPCHACLNNESERQITIFNENKSVHKVAYEKQIDTYSEMRLPLAKENLGLKINSGQPCLEFVIEKPHTEISVGIKGIFNNKETAHKPSKIPRRLSQSLAVQLTCQSSRKKDNRVLQASTNKSLIPQRKKLLMDDMAIKEKKTTHKKDNKLNKTL